MTCGTAPGHQRTLPHLVEITGSNLPTASDAVGGAGRNPHPDSRWETIRPASRTLASDVSRSSTIFPDTHDEQHLIAAAQRDSAAFAPLYERYVDQIYRYAYRRVGNHADAEDVTAQTFQQALAALPNYEWRGVPFGAWLYRIARNVIILQTRRAAREIVGEDVPAVIEDRTASSDDPAAVIEQDVDSAELLAAIQQLSLDQQRALVLKFSHGLTNKEVGQRLSRSEGAVKQLTYRAMTTLRRQLQPDQSETHLGPAMEFAGLDPA